MDLNQYNLWASVTGIYIQFYYYSLAIEKKTKSIAFEGFSNFKIEKRAPEKNYLSTFLKNVLERKKKF